VVGLFFLRLGEGFSKVTHRLWLNIARLMIHTKSGFVLLSIRNAESYKAKILLRVSVHERDLLNHGIPILGPSAGSLGFVKLADIVP
jgi:hypothetical protein